MPHIGCAQSDHGFGLMGHFFLSGVSQTSPEGSAEMELEPTKSLWLEAGGQLKLKEGMPGMVAPDSSLTLTLT